MQHIICSRTASSLLFAMLLREMLHMHDSSIIWKSDHLATEKNTLDIDGYTHEYLLAEFERRYGQVRWFHDHTENMEALRQQLQAAIAEEGDAEAYTSIARAILSNNLASLPGMLRKSVSPADTLRLLTSSFARAGWAQ